MKEYLAFVLSFEGQVLQTIVLVCDTEEDAFVERARQRVDSHPVELWDSPRRVARFRTRTEFTESLP